MSMRIITGYTAQPHITSDDDAALHRGLIGAGDFVLNVGNMFAATIVTNNLVKIQDGEIVIQGKQGRINTNDYEELVINNGTQGMKRNDIIVARYSKNSSTGIESIVLAVVQGTPAATAVDPALTQGDIPSGALIREVPLYRVAINGINIESVTKMFSTASSLAEMMNEASKVENGWWKDKKTGLIIQWGRNANAVSSDKARVNFPIAFPNRLLNINFTGIFVNAKDNFWTRGATDYATYFEAHRTSVNAPNIQDDFNWIAVGY